MFSTSRRDAQRRSTLSKPDVLFDSFDINGTGSIPVSAIQPAKTEKIVCSPSSTACKQLSYCFAVKIAVTSNLILSLDKCRIGSAKLRPRVMWTGISRRAFAISFYNISLPSHLFKVIGKYFKRQWLPIPYFN